MMLKILGGIFVFIVLVLTLFFVHERITHSATESFKDASSSIRFLADLRTPEANAARRNAYETLLEKEVTEQIAGVQDALNMARGSQKEADFKGKGKFMQEAEWKASAVNSELANLQNIPPEYQKTQQFLLAGLGDYVRAFDFQEKTSRNELFSSQGKKFLSSGNTAIMKAFLSQPEETTREMIFEK